VAAGATYLKTRFVPESFNFVPGTPFYNRLVAGFGGVSRLVHKMHLAAKGREGEAKGVEVERAGTWLPVRPLLKLVLYQIVSILYQEHHFTIAL